MWRRLAMLTVGALWAAAPAAAGPVVHVGVTSALVAPAPVVVAPPRVVVHRTVVRPPPRRVWVDGYWTHDRRGRRIFVEGHWSTAPPPVVRRGAPHRHSYRGRGPRRR